MENLVIQPACLNDAPQLANLHYDIFGQAQWDEAYWRASLEGAGGVVYLASQVQKPIGLYALQKVMDEAEILTLGVVSSARGKGVAPALLSHSFENLAKEGVKKLFLEVSILNKAALTLYERQGFQRIRERKDYYAPGEDAIVMARSFPS